MPFLPSRRPVKYFAKDETSGTLPPGWRSPACLWHCPALVRSLCPGVFQCVWTFSGGVQALNAGLRLDLYPPQPPGGF